MNLTEIAQLAFIPIVFIASYLALKPLVPAWSEPDRGFHTFEKEWPRIFTGGGIGAIIVTVLLMIFSSTNIVTALTLGVTSGFLLMGAYTDSIIHKVPAEFNELAIRISMILGLGALVYNGFAISEGSQKFYDTPAVILIGDWYYWLAGGLLVGLVGFLIWMRISGIVGLLAILITAGGLWVAFYAALRELAIWLSNSSFVNVMSPEGIYSVLVFGIPSALAVLLVASAFQLGADGKMGGADPAAMYSVGWTFAPVIGGIMVGIGVIVASIVQLLLHAVARPLKLSGRVREVPHDPLVYSFKKLWWKVNNKEGTPPKTYKSLGLPFLPVLNLSAIVTMIVAISIIN